MKNILLMILCLSFLCTCGQNTKNEFDGPAWKAPYYLSLEGWSIERFLIPIDFAPKIAYTGVEDLRFTLGWGNAESDEYWTYAYLWFLDGKPKTNSEIIQNNLIMYYDGLVGRNIEKRGIPSEKIIPTKASINKIKTQVGDLNTFSGKIEMLDYMQQKPIILNCIIHEKSCANQNKTFVFFEISPKPFTHNVWKRLNKLWTDFHCSVSKTE